MSEKLTNEAAWLTAVNIVCRLGDQINARENPHVLNTIFEQVKAGMVVHHYLAGRPEPSAPSRN
jgi:hypothetical protein